MVPLSRMKLTIQPPRITANPGKWKSQIFQKSGLPDEMNWKLLENGPKFPVLELNFLTKSYSKRAKILIILPKFSDFWTEILIITLNFPCKFVMRLKNQQVNFNFKGKKLATPSLERKKIFDCRKKGEKKLNFLKSKQKYQLKEKRSRKSARILSFSKKFQIWS